MSSPVWRWERMVIDPLPRFPPFSLFRTSRPLPALAQAYTHAAMVRRLLLASLLAASLSLSAAAQNGQTAVPINDPNDAKPWPDAAALERARQAAEQRPLFAS